MARDSAKLNACLHHALPLTSMPSGLLGALSKVPERADDVSIHEPPRPVTGSAPEVFTSRLIHAPERLLFVSRVFR